ncbi:MAG TPA: Hpt domain-containing protein, partial [Myxococcota bacterium]|nr:Hpt domain-containing protein [Myxococcota bacterium]
MAGGGVPRELREVFFRDAGERLRSVCETLDRIAARRAPFASEELARPLRDVYAARNGALLAGEAVVGGALGAVEAALDRLMARPSNEPIAVVPALELLSRAAAAVTALAKGLALPDGEGLQAAAHALGGVAAPARSRAPSDAAFAAPHGGAAADATAAQAARAGAATAGVAGVFVSAVTSGSAAPTSAPASARPAPRIHRLTEWVPTVPPDMLEPFFEEAGDRLEGLSEKLLRLEVEPTDRELLNEIFRDIHTVKGGSGIVGLAPMNELAHRLEDFFGEIRDGRRSVMQPDVDLLLSGLDRLKAILEKARARAPIDVDYADVLAALPGGAASPHGSEPARAAEPTPEPELAADAGSRRPPMPARPAAAPAFAKAATSPSAAPPRPVPAPAAAAGTAGRGTLRVEFEKLDALMNLVGELVIGKTRVHDDVGNLAELQAELVAARRQVAGALRGAPLREVGGVAREADRAVREAAVGANGAGTAFNELRAVIARVFERAALAEHEAAAARVRRVDDELGRVEKLFETVAQGLAGSSGALDFALGQLQHQVMKLRMVPIGTVFTKYRRTVRDLARDLGKEIAVEIDGADTELDKVLVERIDDPLMHLVRNCCDHGVEAPGERERRGKARSGTVTLRAEHRGNQIVVEVGDDGAGIPIDRVRAKAREQGLIAPERLDAMAD